MKRLFAILCGVGVCNLCSGMTHSYLIFVNDSKFNTYIVDASELKNATLAYEGSDTLIQQTEIHPNRYVETYIKTQEGYTDYGNITIKRDDNVVSVLNFEVPEHFTSWKLFLDNENWWGRFSVNEQMQTVVEHQRWHGVEHYIITHDYNPKYRYSNQPQVLEYWSLHFDGIECPEPPADGDPRPQIRISPIACPLSRDGYKREGCEEESEKGGGCCLLL